MGRLAHIATTDSANGGNGEVSNDIDSNVHGDDLIGDDVDIKPTDAADVLMEEKVGTSLLLQLGLETTAPRMTNASDAAAFMLVISTNPNAPIDSISNKATWEERVSPKAAAPSNPMQVENILLNSIAPSGFMCAPKPATTGKY